MSASLTVNAGVRYDLEWLQTINTDSNNVSPRIGLVAWSPFANRGTVVRASYGLFYDRVPLRPLANALLSANNTIDPAQARFFSYTFSPTDAGAPIFPVVAAAPSAGAKPNYSTMDRGIQSPYSLQASLEVEQQLSPTSTLGISYQHLRGLHLISSINININLDGTRPDATRGKSSPTARSSIRTTTGLRCRICSGLFRGDRCAFPIRGPRRSMMSASSSSAHRSITSISGSIAAGRMTTSGIVWSSMRR